MKYRTINVDLNREYRNDLNWNFEQIAKDIEQSDNVSEEDKKELLEEIARVERESKERDDLLAGESLEDFLTKIRNAIDGADEATENANQSADNADDKALYATEQGDYAKEQGDYAKEQAEFANTKAEYADEKAIYANEMAGKASDEASNLSGLKNNVAEATTKANQSAVNADEKAEYAETQGKRAENASDLVQDLIDEGPVQSVNGKRGAVELSASDVGAETPEGAQEKANQALTEAKEYADQSLEMGKYKWQYNESTDSLDLVVIE